MEKKLQHGRRAENGADATRRARLREVYRRHVGGAGTPVDMARVHAAVRRVAAATLAGWRDLSGLDFVCLAEAGSREEFEELEFLVNRGLFELAGIKNIVALARHLA